MAPSGSIQINNAAQYVNSTSVILALNAVDSGSGLNQMQFSNDGTTWSTPEAYATTKNWTLVSGDGTKTVYVKFKDVAGNWSVSYSATIILDTTPSDTTPPTGTIKINSGAPYTNSISVTLALSAQDNPGGSGVSQMQFSNDNTTWSTPEVYATAKAWTLSSGDDTKTVYVKFKDVAGNWSVSYSATIILDTTPPQINITSPSDNQVIEAK
jgi:hypothetical protein